MSVAEPIVRHIYQNHALDSTRWDHYTPRADDIVIATPYKSGTTWMQLIVMHLIFQDLQIRPVWELSPWLEHCGTSIEDVLEKLEAQKHRRFIKTHLPLDGLPYFEQNRYIVVGRDPRDVFMSLWNHYANFRDEVFENAKADCSSEPLPRYPDDILDFWREWISNGWFEWEREGYPFWSNLRHVQTWWNHRHLPNILFVHFSDLLRDLEGEIQHIADFLEIDLTSEFRSRIAQAVTFKNVKENAEQLLPQAEGGWKGGAKTFINKGTNGRWRAVLSDADLALYHVAVARELSPDCARWLESGRNGNESR
jgi:aryl sulfotransferase